MVGVPSALYLAAGLLAVAAASGLVVVLLQDDPQPATTERGVYRLVAVGGAGIYALSHILAGAQIGGPGVWTWLHAIGLIGIAVGVSRTQLTKIAGLGLVIPMAPVIPAYVAAAAGLVAAGRIARAGRPVLLLSAGLAVMSAGHALAPNRADLSSGAFVVGAVLIGAWLWAISSRRILLKLLTAFASALVAMAIIIAAVLSTVSSAQLTRGELDRLGRVADQLTTDIQSFPQQAVAAAQPLSTSVDELVRTTLDPIQAAGVFDLSLSTQDFFLTLDAAGQVVNLHPPSLAGSTQLALAGDPLILALREGAALNQVGGLLTSGDTILAFGATALRDPGGRPEDPPAGVLITGRRIDDIYAAQQAAMLDVEILVVVGGQAVLGTDQGGVSPSEVLDALGARERADLTLDQGTLFAASSAITDPARPLVIGRILTTSTPQVIASVEREQNQRLFLASLIGGALGLVVAFTITRRFLRPISRLTEVAEQVGAGDLANRANIDSADEVGVLGATFDEMVESLSEQQQDLTVSAQREATLRGRLESLTSSMSDGLVAVDDRGEIITFNPAAQSMTGRRAADAVGNQLDHVLVGTQIEDGAVETVHGSSGDALQLRDAMDDRSSSSRILLTRGDGSRLPVSASAAPVRAPNGEILGRVYVLRDITRDLEVEQMKTEFLANVSHELRTPITPIKGYANVLARRELPPDKTRQFANQILDSTKRLERIVAMIVDFAGLDSGRVTMSVEAVEIGGLVSTVLDQWREDHDDRDFQADVAPFLPPVSADVGYLTRCVNELVDNAVKFSPEGQAIAVRARHVANRVELAVVDHGIGIEEEATRRLFSDFVQIDGTETRSYGGLGLGLGLVKRIVDGISGQISVTSRLGEGTTVTVSLLPAGPVIVPRLPSPPPPRGSVPVPPGA